MLLLEPCENPDEPGEPSGYNNSKEVLRYMKWREHRKLIPEYDYRRSRAYFSKDDKTP